MRTTGHPGGAIRTAVDRATLLLAGGFTCLAAAAASGRVPVAVAMVVALVAATVAWHRALLRWPTAIGSIICIILFIPIGRYKLPVHLPFQLELYRIAVAITILCWIAALLTDSRLRLRRTPFDRPLAVILGASLASDLVNIGRVAPLESVVLKSITFFLSFMLLYYLIVSMVRDRQTVERLAKLLVCGVAIVAVFAVVEQRTNYNVFDHVSAVLPFLQFEGGISAERNGLVRAIGSSEHPIALGVLFAMTVPLGVAFAFSRGRRWAIPTVLILLGMMASVSRTPIVVLFTGAIVIAWLRPRDARRLLPLLIPAVIVVKVAVPGSIATVKNSFFPQGGLVAEQSRLDRNADPMLAGGRIRLIGPSLRQAAGRPLFGQGFATRQTGFTNPHRNAPILDDNWLGLLLEVGVIGVVGWSMLLVRAVRRLGRESRRRAGPDGWLHVGLAGAIAGFGVGMFTYDSLTFVQISFVLWIVISLASVLLLVDPDGGRTEPTGSKRKARGTGGSILVPGGA